MSQEGRYSAGKAAQLAGDVEDGGEAEGESGAEGDLAYAAVSLPRNPAEASGIGPGNARNRQRPAPVGKAVSKGLEQTVLDPRAEAAAVARLIAGVPVHEGGETVADAGLHRRLGG